MTSMADLIANKETAMKKAFDANQWLRDNAPDLKTTITINNVKVTLPGGPENWTDEALEDFLYRPVLDSGWFRYSSIELTLASGRKCRYELADFPFRLDATPPEIDELASRIVEQKYKFSQWDHNHPDINTETEIFRAIRDWMLAEINKVRAMRASDE